MTQRLFGLMEIEVCLTQPRVKSRCPKGMLINYIRKLNPGGPVRATAREDHLVWWAACHPELAGQDPVSLTDKARELGYSTLLIESQEVLRLPGG